ncbi:histidinol dehydrogenase [Anaerosolibacter carboniphilus]|uniref:Histidinol dehydrogenase n=1 Tax=Anaerosolibacter carboniphilus TaxID=1417629 RepID=A0A841KZW8_9FIRM|nr:histidinol dehydrogenase [Anaerosolibacter carboniphilus]MBB6215675.1 histidinol dehydrogenase [Anaerosolibacter carboniphilus]
MKIVYFDDMSQDDLDTKYLNRGDTANNEIDAIVDQILKEVKRRGDAALQEYTLKFDGVTLSNIRVSQEEVEEAFSKVEPEFVAILKEAKENIWYYHEKQKQNSWFRNPSENIILGQMVTPLERIGIYVPGGKAAYPSTVLMNAIPALVAGVDSIAMVSPPNKEGKLNPYVLVAANLCGVREIYKVGGAQSIGALAFGTKTIPPVDKIVGPGNSYVAMAKKKVYGSVDIDMIAGPSEICILADNKGNATFIAADLLSQAEHDEDAGVILVTTSQELAEKVQEEVKRQAALLIRKEIIQKSLKNHGYIFVVPDLEIGFRLVNKIAPEHLELMVDSPFDALSKIKNAGAIFLGAYSPEPLGDYFAGPNHTLPTGGTARFSSPLGVDDFIKKSSIIYYNRSALDQARDQIIYFAEKEGLTAHANAIRVRDKG